MVHQLHFQSWAWGTNSEIRARRLIIKESIKRASNTTNDPEEFEATLKELLGWSNHQETHNEGLLWLLVEHDLGDRIEGVFPVGITITLQEHTSPHCYINVDARVEVATMANISAWAIAKIVNGTREIDGLEIPKSLKKVVKRKARMIREQNEIFYQKGCQKWSEDTIMF